MDKNKHLEAQQSTIKICSILFLMLFLTSFISAVPPVTTIQQFTEGYQIQIPQDNILKVNNPYLFEFHVFNISNGVPKTSGISCDLHLYDNLGRDFYKGTDSSADAYGDYSFNISANNFTISDNYYYFVRCNSSTLGGFAESILYITPSGKAPIENYMFIFIFALSIIAISLALYLLIINIGKFATFSTTLKDVAFNLSFLFFIIFVSWLSTNYAVDSILTNFSSWIIIITAFLNGLFPIISFVVTLFVKGTTKMTISSKELFGE